MIDKDANEILLEGDTGALLCLEGMVMEVLALSIVESDIIESLSLIKDEANNLIIDCKNIIVKAK